MKTLRFHISKLELPIHIDNEVSKKDRLSKLQETVQYGDNAEITHGHPALKIDAVTFRSISFFRVDTKRKG